MTLPQPPAATGPSFPTPVDGRGHAVDPRTGRILLGRGQRIAVIIGAIVAVGMLGLCSIISLLLAFAADGCSAATSTEGNDACMSAMGLGVSVAYGGFFVLAVFGLVLLVARRVPPAMRVVGVWSITVLAPAITAVAWIIASAGQPGSS